MSLFETQNYREERDGKRKTDTQTLGDRQGVSSIHWLTPRLATTTKAWPGSSQGPGASSGPPRWVQGPKWPSSAAFPDARGAWAEAEQSGSAWPAYGMLALWAEV